MRMSEWEYPLEMVKYGPNNDENGNAFFEVRDAKRRSCFFVRINGRETFEKGDLEREIVPGIVDGFNERAAVVAGVAASVDGNGGGGVKVVEIGNVRNKKPDSYYREICDAISGGMSWVEAGKKFDLGEGRLRQIVKEWGGRV